MRITTLPDLQPAGLERFTGSVLRAQRAAVAMPHQTADGPALAAEINHGRWIVRCPACGGAEMVDPSDPRFFCLSCHNEAHGGKWLPVKLPSASHRSKLEAELLKRPRSPNRNWLPGETLKQLQGDNTRMGVV
jgi:hypothetical protein